MFYVRGRLSKPDKGEKFWGVECPILDIATQGESREDAIAMLKEAAELLAETAGLVLKTVVIERKGDDEVYIGSEDVKAFIGLLLRQQRGIAGITAPEASRRLGFRSVNGYSAYEQGKVEPSLSMLTKLLTALNPSATPFLEIGGNMPEEGEENGNNETKERRAAVGV